MDREKPIVLQPSVWDTDNLGDLIIALSLHHKYDHTSQKPKAIAIPKNQNAIAHSRTHVIAIPKTINMRSHSSKLPKGDCTLQSTLTNAIALQAKIPKSDRTPQRPNAIALSQHHKGDRTILYIQ
jgi:hypothetical protein